MSKLYYDCPIKAAYMAKEFGAKTVCPDGLDEPDTMTALINDMADPEIAPDKYYIHPDSLYIFEPKVGDVIITKQEDHTYIAHGIENRTDLYSGCSNIIRRNGNAFIMPETEK